MAAADKVIVSVIPRALPGIVSGRVSSTGLSMRRSAATTGRDASMMAFMVMDAGEIPLRMDGLGRTRGPAVSCRNVRS